MPKEFLKLVGAQTNAYRGFPHPAFICDKKMTVRWANTPAKLEYSHFTEAGSPLLSEFDPAEVFAGLGKHGSLVIRDAIPMSDKLLSLLPIIYESEAIGLVVLVLPDTVPIHSPEASILSGGTANALTSSIRDGAEQIFSAMDAAFTKASMLDSALWLTPHLNEVSLQVYRMMRTAKNIAKFADLQKGCIALQQSPLDVNTYLRDINETVSGLCASAGVPVEFNIPEGSAFLYVDRECFEHALYNILFNSVIYTREGNRITVSAYGEGGRICISVADKGQGIPMVMAERVFMPYISIPAPKNKHGIGLGLTIAKWLTTMQGGSLELTTKENEGTTVVFSFPDHSFSRVLPLAQRDDPYILTDRFSNLYVGLAGILEKPYIIGEGEENP